jgi:glutamine cyclotransferase
MRHRSQAASTTHFKAALVIRLRIQGMIDRMLRRMSLYGHVKDVSRRITPPLVPPFGGTGGVNIGTTDISAVLFSIIAISLLCGFSHSPKYAAIQTRILKKVPLPRWYHEGLYFDGKNIWVSNGLKGKTWIVDPDSGSIKDRIESAGPFTEAITSQENGLYIVTDWELKKIYTARVDNNIMTVVTEKSLLPAHPAGAIWNGSNIFVITWTRSPAGTKHRLLTMDERFNILKSEEIKKIHEPSQLAWDGKYLWISSWYNKRVYKVDAQTLEILGYFRSPVKKTTGIVWDGKYFWVTGTYSDLYKIELPN